MRPADAGRLFAAAEKALRSAGVARAQRCLDFGCGHGSYAIPLARLVGPEGVVYALDKDSHELDRLVERARAAGLGNITRMDSPGGTEIGLPDGSVDAVLLYDVLHSHYFAGRERVDLLREVNRVAAPAAFLSVFPRHMSDEEIAELTRQVEKVGFRLVRQHRGAVVHDDGVTQGHIITFRQEGDE